jgi:DNA repair exonuclease SbcCD ATPase subunit
VTVAPGHTCNAPFTTLDPEDHATVMQALDNIRRELEGKR